MDKPAEKRAEPTLDDYLTKPTLLSMTVRRKSIENITRKNVLDFVSFLRRRGNQRRTIRNRVDYFQIFLHHFGLPSVLKGKDLPTFTEKKVRAYNSFELDRMFIFAARRARG